MNRRLVKKPEEYTDYSCSTGTERLARDVETLLRAWHLSKSDRHVSFDEKKPLSENDTKSVSSASALQQSGDFDFQNEDMTSTTTSRKKKTKKNTSVAKKRDAYVAKRKSWKLCDGMNQPADHSVQLIRSDEIEWVPSLSSSIPSRGKSSAVIFLKLELWDGPTQYSSSCALNQDDKGHQKNGDEAHELPLSLRRCPLSKMPLDVFSNLSTLFGIGQHLTLSLSDRNRQDQDQESTTLTVYKALGKSVEQRHEESLLSPWVMTSCLSKLLQMSLHCALSNVQCNLPAFGIWGQYDPSNLVFARSRPQKNGGDDIVPFWMRPISEHQENKHGDPRHSTRSSIQQGSRGSRLLGSLFEPQKTHVLKNQLYMPPILSSRMLSPTEFSLCVIPFVETTPDSSSNRLTAWGHLLLQHTASPNSATVGLYGAKHVYTWSKQQPQSSRRNFVLPSPSTYKYLSDWRQDTDVEIGGVDPETETVEHYRDNCRKYALSLIESIADFTIRMTSRTSFREPLWGPADDPVSSVQVTVTWDSRKKDAQGCWDNIEPLLTMPLRIRSQQDMAPSDWLDMEDSVERTILDPTHPSTFFIKVAYDEETNVAPMAANQQLLLAALIRTATLPASVSMQQLTMDNVTDEWNSAETEVAALQLVNKAEVGDATRRLVQAMDWGSVGEEMIRGWEADRIVQHAFDPSLVLCFPGPPERMFGSSQGKKAASPKDPLFNPLYKSAPAGRLLSMLFVSMARLKSPSSMALVWMHFVHELRRRWDTRESLPNMNYIPGIDPPAEDLNRKRCFSSIGLKAENSAFVHCSEPDPDEQNCLIGQKLQVFNLGMEAIVAMEMYEMEKLAQKSDFSSIQNESVMRIVDAEDQAGTKRKAGEKFDTESAASVASTEIMHNGGTPSAGTTEDEPSNPRNSRLQTTTIEGVPVNSNSFDPISEEQSEFFDAEESLEESHSSGGASTGIPEAATNVTQRQKRHGARCPVFGLTLLASNDQLYAPYLQRPQPLTDDVILERQLMLSRQASNSRQKTVQNRIEIAQRLQKPKLLSDMRSFQAANPGAVFQDFVYWYGNPGNPLEEYKEEEHVETSQPQDMVGKSVGIKMDLASEAIQILTSTRDFWTSTWEEATPCPAIDQEPLFDVESTVEMVLDSLETIHPANFVNQVMAVNLSTSYFSLLAAAGEALQIELVKSKLLNLREKVNQALALLSRDASLGSSAHEIHKDRRPRHASIETIQACEEACRVLGDAEALLARAMSLIHKLPGKYDLIQDILIQLRDQNNLGSKVYVVQDSETRETILSVIHEQQQRNNSGDATARLPQPSLREYVLRNIDSCGYTDASPCQLNVRFGDDDSGNVIVLLALAKTRATR